MKTARAAGLGPDAVERLGAAHGLAMAVRSASLPGEHHPAYLHPGRSALVLLLDVHRPGRPLPPEALLTAVLTESEDPGLAVPRERIVEVLGPGVADGVGRVPVPSRARPMQEGGVPPDRLLEALVSAPEVERLVALAERLDHLRHAHLRPPPFDGARVLEEARAVYGPVAHRTHPVLARRIDAWCRRFGRRVGRRP